MPTEPITCAAVIVAAGRGRRAGDNVPKQFALIGGKTVLRRTASAFAKHGRIGTIIVVIHPDDEQRVIQALDGIDYLVAHGGATRQDSVFAGLAELKCAAPDLVLIHDAARPFVSDRVIDQVIDAAWEFGGAVAGVPVADTIKRAVTDDRRIAGTVSRENLWRAQTPQGFRYIDILDAHQSIVKQSLTDDSAVAEAAGMRVVMTRGSEENFKITTAEDLDRAARLSAANARETVTVIGQGFDVHAFEAGNHISLCGVKIPHDQRLKGHSDADVALHALTDAILGAIGAGDIGQYFPDSNPEWRGVSSDRFLRHALDLVATREGRLINLDLTVICESPRLQPHRNTMQANLQTLTGLPLERIGLKATTTEKLGFTGRGEGVAAQAVVSVSLPENG